MAILHSNFRNSHKLDTFFIKRIIAVVFLFIFATGNLSLLHSQPKAINQKRIEAENIRREIQRLDVNASIATENFNEAREKLTKINTNIATNNSAIDAAKKKLAARQGVLGQRANAMYKYGAVSFIEMILNSKDFADLINRWNYLMLITKQDSQIIGDIKNTKEVLAKKMITLENEQNNQVKQSIVLKKHKVEIEKSLAHREQLLKNKTAEILQLEKEERALEARLRAEAEAALKRQQEAEKAAAKLLSNNKNNENRVGGGNPSYSSLPPNSSKASSVVAIAMQYVGVKYVWGGSTPSGFDCSGFTSYVYAKVGISITRTSRSQFKKGRSVSRGSLAPGDLVFFGSPTIHHVGINLGGGRMIDAPHSGSYVGVRSFTSRRDYRGARRYL